ncbi:MAG TPA: hypothetical protein VMX74_00045 [Pirellulales bacterium]|nr:hypothetical protein [Pirellulales bacterium]
MRPIQLLALSTFSLNVLFATIASGQIVSQPGIHAGAAERDITPPVGIEIHPDRPNIGVNDPLFLRTLVLQDAEGTSFALITADIICAGFVAMDELRSRVKRETGVSEVWFNCSHAHSSRWLRATPTKGQEWTDELAWDEFYERPLSEEPEVAQWNAKVHKAAVETVAEAKKKLIPVTLHAGRAQVQVGFNRRVTPANGRTHMGVNREGPAVPWVNVLVAKDRKTNESVAVLFEHTAHPVTVPDTKNLVSADFPGAAVARIREQLGKDVIALFGQGCLGNINSFPLRSTQADADTAGQKLGDAVLKAMRESEPIKATTIKLRTQRIQLPTRPFPDPDVVKELQEQNKDHPARLKQLNKISDLQQSGGTPPPRRFDVYGVMLGDDWCLVGMSYETFSQYELWIDKHAPFKRTMAFCLTNGGRAYIGTDEALAMGPNGGYEAACLPNWGGHETMSPHLGPPALGSEKMIHKAFESLWR